MCTAHYNCVFVDKCNDEPRKKHGTHKKKRTLFRVGRYAIVENVHTQRTQSYLIFFDETNEKPNETEKTNKCKRIYRVKRNTDLHVVHYG